MATHIEPMGPYSARIRAQATPAPSDYDLMLYEDYFSHCERANRVPLGLDDWRAKQRTR